MIGIVWRSLTARVAGLAGCAVALALGVALITAAGLTLASTLDGPDPAPRWYQLPQVVVAGPAVAGTSPDDPDGGFGGPALPPTERGYLPPETATALSTVSGAARVVVDRAGYAHDGSATEAHPWSAAAVHPYAFVAGGPPVADDEVVVTANGVRRVGERITVDTVDGRQSFTVSGVLSRVLRSDGPPTLYVTDATAARLARDRITAIAVFAAPGTGTEALATAVRAALAHQPQLRVLTGDDRRQAEVDPDAGLLLATTTLLAEMAAIAAFVSAFVVSGTFAFAVNQRRRELGLLRIAGATPRQVRRLVLGEALGVGALAGVVGCGLGAVLASPLAHWLARVGLAPAWFTARFAVWPFVAAYLFGLGLALAGAATAARRAGRIQPTEALRVAGGQRPAMTRTRWVSGLVALAGAVAVLPLLRTPEGAAYLLLLVMLLIGAATLLAPAVTPGLVRLLSIGSRGPSGLLARHSALSAARRTASIASPVLVTVGLAGASLAGTATLSAAQGQSVRDHVSAPVVVVAGESVLTDQVVATARRTPGVTAAVAVKQTVVYDRVDGSVRQRSAWYLDAATAPLALRLPVTSGSLADLSGDSVVMADSLANAHGWSSGDQVVVWLGDGAQARLRLVATTADRLGLPAVLLPWAMAASHSARPLPDAVYLALAAGANHAPIETTQTEAAQTEATQIEAARIQAAQIQAVVRPMGAELLSTGTYLRTLDAEFDRLSRLALLAIIGLALVYTGVSVANTALMSSAARGAEFAVLRRSGARTGQVRRIVVREAVLSSLVGALIGLAVTAVALLAVAVALDPVAAVVPIVVAWGPLTTIVAATVLLAATSAVVAIRSA